MQQKISKTWIAGMTGLILLAPAGVFVLVLVAKMLFWVTGLPEIKGFLFLDPVGGFFQSLVYFGPVTALLLNIQITKHRRFREKDRIRKTNFPSWLNKAIVLESILLIALLLVYFFIQHHRYEHF